MIGRYSLTSRRSTTGHHARRHAFFRAFLIVIVLVAIHLASMSSWKAELILLESWEGLTVPVDTAAPISGDILRVGGEVLSSLSSPSQWETNRNHIQTTPNSEHILKQASNPEVQFGLGTMKILVYMTTHLSEEHKLFLPCWDGAITRFRILHNADLIMYTSQIPNEDILSHFRGFKNISVKMYEERTDLNNWRWQKQAGAVKAMIVPWEQGWFEGYDWVIRLNPDVLIRNETWLLETMVNALHEDDESSPVALVVRCRGKNTTVHTDFTVFRPSKLLVDDFVNRTFNPNQNAEDHMSKALARFSNRQLVIPGTRNFPACRVLGRESPVIHDHRLAKFCPDYYNKTDAKFF